MPDDYILCCAARVCCHDNSPEQVTAVADLILAEMPAKHRKSPDAREYAESAAKTMVKHFVLQDRKGRTTPEEFKAE